MEGEADGPGVGAVVTGASEGELVLGAAVGFEESGARVGGGVGSNVEGALDGGRVGAAVIGDWVGLLDAVGGSPHPAQVYSQLERTTPMSHRFANIYVSQISLLKIFASSPRRCSSKVQLSGVGAELVGARVGWTDGFGEGPDDGLHEGADVGWAQPRQVTLHNLATADMLQ